LFRHPSHKFLVDLDPQTCRCKLEREGCLSHLTLQNIDVIISHLKTSGFTMKDLRQFQSPKLAS
jgi:hypothetical protein